MAEKDISEKMLKALSDVFADIVSVLLFNGEQRVEPDDLEEMAGWSGYKVEAGLYNEERDVAKWWKKAVSVLPAWDLRTNLGLILMVLGIYGYDGASYTIQCTKENRTRGKPMTFFRDPDGLPIDFNILRKLIEKRLVNKNIRFL